MNSFETLNEDEVHFFSYFEYDIEYLEKLFNRHIEYEIGTIIHSVIEFFNEKVVNIGTYNDKYIFGIIFKLKKHELNNLVEINNKEYQSNYALKRNENHILYNLCDLKKITSYYFKINMLNNSEINISFDELSKNIKSNFYIKIHNILKKILKILYDCKKIYDKRLNNNIIVTEVLLYEQILYSYTIQIYYYDMNNCIHKKIIC